MDNLSSAIDGSIAIAGMIAALAVSGWALISSESTAAVETEDAEAASRTIVKKAA